MTLSNGFLYTCQFTIFYFRVNFRGTTCPYRRASIENDSQVVKKLLWAIQKPREQILDIFYSANSTWKLLLDKAKACVVKVVIWLWLFNRGFWMVPIGRNAPSPSSTI